MKKGHIITTDAEIRAVLTAAKTIAVLGVSPKPDRDSHLVAKYIKENGFKMIPVRPAQKTILDEPAYAGLDDIDTGVDIIDVFRRADQVMAHAKEALRLQPAVFWMQLGIQNDDAAALLTDHGVDVVMDRCIKEAHERLFKNQRL